MLRAGGPAVLFENPTGHKTPVLANLFGTPERVAWGMGADDVGALHGIGELLANLKEPQPPRGIKDAVQTLPLWKKVLSMAPKRSRKPPCHANVLEGSAVNLGDLPVQTCWPGDAGPLITWALVE